MRPMVTIEGFENPADVVCRVAAAFGVPAAALRASPLGASATD